MLASTKDQNSAKYQRNKMWLAHVCCVMNHVCKLIYFRWKKYVLNIWKDAISNKN